MQDKESIIVVRCELKIPSLGITVRHHSASLVMPNSYPRDGIFNPHLTTINDSYYILVFQIRRAFRNIRRTVPEIANVLILFFMNVLLFALLAVKLFGRR